MLTDKTSKRSQELQEKSDSLPFAESEGTRVPVGVWEEWATNRQNLMKVVFGKDSPHYTNLKEALMTFVIELPKYS